MVTIEDARSQLEARRGDIEPAQQQLQAANQFKAEESAKDRQTKITEAEIRAAGYGAQVDINQNQQSDYQDAMNNIRKQDEYQQTMNFKREQEINRTAQTTDKHNIEREKLQAQQTIADKQLQIAVENKNKYDAPKPKEKKK